MKTKLIILFCLASSLLFSQNYQSICNVGNLQQTQVTVCAKFTNTGLFDIKYGTDSNLSTFSLIDNITINAASNTGFGVIDGLSPNTTYYYQVVCNTTSGIFKFRTLPSDGNNVEIAAISCQQDGNNPIFDKLEIANPDLVVHLGDYGYTDSYNVTTIRTNYENQSNNTDWANEIVKQIGVERIWDDHDFGPNDSNGKNPLKTNSLQVFKEWSAHYDLASPNEGIWRKHRVNDIVEMFFTDSRYQRIEPTDVVSYTKNVDITNNKVYNLTAQADGFYNRFYLKLGTDYFKIIDYTAGVATLDYDAPDTVGASVYLNNASLLDAYNANSDQDRWLIDMVNSSTSEWKLIFSTSPINPTITASDPAGSDTWGGFDSNDMELNYLMQRIDRKNVIIASGDRHFCAIDDGTNSGWAELLSSPVDNKNSFIGKHGTWSNGSYDTDDYYGIIDFNSTQATLTNYGADGVQVQQAIISRQVELPPTAPLSYQSGSFEDHVNSVYKICNCD